MRSFFPFLFPPSSISPQMFTPSEQDYAYRCKTILSRSLISDPFSPPSSSSPSLLPPSRRSDAGGEPPLRCTVRSRSELVTSRQGYPRQPRHLGGAGRRYDSSCVERKVRNCSRRARTRVCVCVCGGEVRLAAPTLAPSPPSPRLFSR